MEFVATADRYAANLARLCGDLASLAEAHGLPASSVAPSKLSERIFLSHSTSDAKFARICRAGALLSPGNLARQNGVPLPPGSAEVILGTQDSVFFYVAPFRYPNTGCGLLFSRTLEEESAATGTSTPFDSGGLASRYTRPDPAEPEIGRAHV